MGKERLVPFVALFILIIGSISSLYVYAMEDTTENVTIANSSYSIQQLFAPGRQRTIEDFTGVALEDIITAGGIANPEDKHYTIIGADGYQKTVTWENMKEGILTEERTTIFSELPKAFRVKDVVEIKVE